MFDVNKNVIRDQSGKQSYNYPRYGRKGHDVDFCYAKTHVDGYSLEGNYDSGHYIFFDFLFCSFHAEVSYSYITSLFYFMVFCYYINIMKWIHYIIQQHDNII